MRTILTLGLLAALTAARYAVQVEWREGSWVASPPALALAPGDTFVLLPADALPVALGESLGGATFTIAPAADAAQSARGEELRNTATPIPCLTCHSIDGTALLAPTWLERFGSERLLADGTSVLFDFSYIMKSVHHPEMAIACKTEADGACAEPWPPTMPPVYGEMPMEDLRAIFHYIRSLSTLADTWSAEPAEGTHSISFGDTAFHLSSGSPTGLMGGAYDEAWALQAEVRYAQWLHSQGQHALFVSQMATLAEAQSDAALGDAFQAAAGHEHAGDHAEVGALLELLAANGTLSLATATVEQLGLLPGIGPVKAQAMVDARDAGGLTLATLRAVKGIGEATYAKIRPFLRD